MSILSRVFHKPSISIKDVVLMLFSVLFLLFVFTAYVISTEQQEEWIEMEFELAGVSFYCPDVIFNSDGIQAKGHIQNLNEFPISIKKVITDGDKISQRIRLLEPGQDIEEKMSSQCTFYIINPFNSKEMAYFDLSEPTL